MARPSTMPEISRQVRIGFRLRLWVSIFPGTEGLQATRRYHVPGRVASAPGSKMLTSPSRAQIRPIPLRTDSITAAAMTEPI